MTEITESALLVEVKRMNFESGMPLQEHFIYQAVEEVMQEGKGQSQGLVRQCLALARELEEEAPSERMEPKGPAENSWRLSLVASKIFGCLEEEAKAVRQKLFDGNPDPPFSNWKDAVTWLYQQKAETQSRQVDWEKVDRLLAQINEISREIERESGEEIYSERRFPYLDLFLSEDGESWKRDQLRVKIWDRKLRLVLDFVDFALRETDLPNHNALNFLLCGVRLLPGIGVQIRDDGGTKMPRTVITVPRSLAEWKDLRVAYKLKRSMEGGGRCPDFISLSIADVVHQRDGIPKKFIGDFWKSVAAEVNLQQKMDPGEGLSFDAARKRFHRLPDSLRIPLIELTQTKGE